jgi:hypothetical protein
MTTGKAWPQFQGWIDTDYFGGIRRITDAFPSFFDSAFTLCYEQYFPKRLPLLPSEPAQIGASLDSRLGCDVVLDLNCIIVPAVCGTAAVLQREGHDLGVARFATRQRQRALSPPQQSLLPTLLDGLQKFSARGASKTTIGLRCQSSLQQLQPTAQWPSRQRSVCNRRAGTPVADHWVAWREIGRSRHSNIVSQIEDYIPLIADASRGRRRSRVGQPLQITERARRRGDLSTRCTSRGWAQGPLKMCVDRVGNSVLILT